MIIRLAIKDILHDWLLSTCLVLAVASIIGPLLILFGIKFGTIETLRNRLIEDPKNREIRPVSSATFSREWVEKTVSGNADVVFIVPMTRQISSSVDARHPSGERTSLTLAPTETGDPLLLDNKVAVPGDDSCVLTEAAATALGAGVGDELDIDVRRIVRGKTEKGRMKLTVSGILDPRASGLKTAFVRLRVLEAVEDYKDGRAVPEMEWSGSQPFVYPVYEGVALFLPAPLTRIEEVLLVNDTGFSEIRQLKTDETPGMLGYGVKPEWSVYLISALKRPVEDDNIAAVKNKLRGKGAVLIPWIRPLPLAVRSIKTDELAEYELMSVSDDLPKVSELQVDRLFNGEEGASRWRFSFPAGDGETVNNLELVVEADGRTLTLPVSAVPGSSEQQVILADAAVAGSINLFRYRNLEYDVHSGQLLLSRRGYAGFRMYADSIDSVAAVQQRLEAEGIAVHTESERIAEVRRLDTYLSLVFWLIAAVGVIGGISAMTASLFASVERKKKELNVLRLLGLETMELVRFPVYQGMVLAGAGVVLAGGVFLVVSLVINFLFRGHLRATESLCNLSLLHYVALLFGVLALSVVSAAIAAIQAVRLDPAEALRDE